MEDNGDLKSLKFDKKEYIGAKLPLFNISFRDKNGEQKNNRRALNRLKLACCFCLFFNSVKFKFQARDFLQNA